MESSPFGRTFRATPSVSVRSCSIRRLWGSLIPIFAGFLIALSLGCASQVITHNERIRLGLEVRLPGGHTVSMPPESTYEQRLRIIDAARTHIAAFEALEARIVPPTRIQVDPTMPARGLLGQWYWNDMVMVYPGERQELPALYHELCHRVYEVRHTDFNSGLWALWDRRGDVVADAIDRARR